MSAKGTIGKSIVLLILIAILALLGLFWFDYLGVIQAKKLFTPVYRLLGLEPQTAEVTTQSGGPVDLDDERFSKRLESLTLREQEITKKMDDVTRLEAQNRQIAQELENRTLAQDEREKAFTAATQQYEDRDKNIAANAEKLTGMQPPNAVAILVAMEDQDLIDTLRKVDELAAAANTTSMVSYWMSLMPPERVAQIQRKMLSKPAAVN